MAKNARALVHFSNIAICSKNVVAHGICGELFVFEIVKNVYLLAHPWLASNEEPRCLFHVIAYIHIKNLVKSFLIYRKYMAMTFVLSFDVDNEELATSISKEI